MERIATKPGSIPPGPRKRPATVNPSKPNDNSLHLTRRSGRRDIRTVITRLILGLLAIGSICTLCRGDGEETNLIHGTFRAAGPAVQDEVFLQEVSRQIPWRAPLLSVGLSGERVFAGSQDGLLEMSGNTLVPVAGVTGPIRKLVIVDGALWAISTEAVYRLDGGAWKRIAQPGVVDIKLYQHTVTVATATQLFSLVGDHLTALTTNPAPFAIERIAPFNDSLYVQGGPRLTFFDGASFGGIDVYGSPVDLGWDWGALPSTTIRDILADGPSLYLATDRGLGVLRGMTLLSVKGADGLPFEDTTCLAKGFTNDLWIGTTRGAIRRVSDHDFHYFAGKRWLPGERVNAIAVAGRSVILATDGGLAQIVYHPMTLEAKAAYYERHLERWGQKRLGFVHKLEWDEAAKEYVREASDNDGGYSSDYLSAQSYRFAVTKDPIARQEAVNTFNALRWLERMTGISGFPARAVWVKGEKGHKSGLGSGGYPAQWHDVPGTPFEWKGDTSSDELCAHFYALNLFIDLAARPDEIMLAKAHLERIASHLVQHQWQLIDLSGKPTRWGRWDPDYFMTEEGRFDQGLQSLEILSFMKDAADLTGDAKFGTAYNRLVELGYPAKTLRQRAVFPPDSVANFEDQLSFWAYWNLLPRESDPVRKSTYRRSFERTWEVIRVEQQPWFNFVYGALTGNDCEADHAVKHLREWPVDLVIYSYQNSHRTDLFPPRGYKVVKAADRPFSPREREPMRWDGWTMQADGGAGGNDVVEPSSWLLAYWMGRYHGFIAPPDVQLVADFDTQPPKGTRLGAQPYDGPPRPELP